MTQYSFGETSPLKLDVTVKDAEAFNRIIDYCEAAGPNLDPRDLWANADAKDLEGYNRVTEVYSDAMIKFGRAVMPADLLDTHLIRN